MEDLPEDLFLKISDLLSTRDRARLALVSKGWRDSVGRTWSSIRFESPSDSEAFKLDLRARLVPRDLVGAHLHRQEQLAWLNRLAAHHPHTLQCLCIDPSLESPTPPIDANSRGTDEYHHFNSPQYPHPLKLQPPQMTSLLHPPYHYPGACFPAPAPECLALMTCLKVLSLSVEQEYLSISRHHGEQHVSLDVFADLPRLAQLKLRLNYSSPGIVTMSQKFYSTGFASLKSLCLDFAWSWDAQMMANVVSRLETLHLVVRSPVLEIMEAPNMMRLGYVGYTGPGNDVLPFRTSGKLHELSSNVPNIPCGFATTSVSNVASLSFLDTAEDVRADDVRQLSSLRSLTQLTISKFQVNSEYSDSVLQPFTALARLKSLHLEDFTHHRNSRREYPQIRDARSMPRKKILWPLDASMVELTSLEASIDSLAVYNAEGMAVRLPALKKLHLSLGRVDEVLSSSTLEVLAIKFDGLSEKTWPDARMLGELPCLHTLTVYPCDRFPREEEVFARTIAGLPRLRKLCIIARRTTTGWNFGYSEHTVEDSVHAILQALKPNTELRVLKLFLPRSTLDLTMVGRVDFPRLQVLNIACKAITLKSSRSSCLTSRDSKDVFLDLHFLEASNDTIKRIQACHVNMTKAGGRGWKYFHVFRQGNQNVEKEDTCMHSERLHAECQAYDSCAFPDFYTSFCDCLEPRAFSMYLRSLR